MIIQDPDNDLEEEEGPDEPPEEMFDTVIRSSLEAQDYINGGGTTGLFDVRFTVCKRYIHRTDPVPKFGVCHPAMQPVWWVGGDREGTSGYLIVIPE